MNVNKINARNRIIISISVTSKSDSIFKVPTYDLKPDEKWQIGDKNQYRIKPHEENGLSFELEAYDLNEEDKNCIDASVLLRQQLARFSSIKDGFLTIEDAVIWVSCIIYFTDAPILTIDREIMQSLTELRTDLDIDLYSNK